MMEARTPHVEATPEVEREVRRRGGLLFVWPKHHGGRFGGVTLLRTSTVPPAEALEYRRVRVGRILVFLSPRLRRLPSKLELALTGWRRRRIAAYWDGCAFAM
jgi:hypothetical protein